MTATVALTGQLLLILVVSGCLGLVASALLLRLYRRAVRRRMRRSTWTSAGITAATTPGTPQPPSAPLRIRYVDAVAREFASDGRALYLRARQAPWRAACVYAVGGLLFAAVLAVAFPWSIGMELQPLRYVFFLWGYVWPLVPTLSLMAATSRRDTLLVVAGYFAVYGAVVLAAVILSPGISARQMIVRGSGIDLTPTLVFSAFLLPRVRAVGPLVVTFMFRRRRRQLSAGPGRAEPDGSPGGRRPLLLPGPRGVCHLRGPDPDRPGCLSAPLVGQRCNWRVAPTRESASTTNP